jgi:hypothetical protein
MRGPTSYFLNQVITILLLKLKYCPRMLRAHPDHTFLLGAGLDGWWGLLRINSPFARQVRLRGIDRPEDFDFP